MLPSFLQNLDIKTIIFLGILFGILGFFVWNKFLNKKKSPEESGGDDQNPKEVVTPPMIVSV